MATRDYYRYHDALIGVAYDIEPLSANRELLQTIELDDALFEDDYSE